MSAETQTSRRRSLAGQKAALKRSRADTDPEYIAVCQNLAVEQLAEHAARVVSTWPAPTPDQLDRVAALLRTGGDAA